ncbi:hypothetical protein [Acuticoccus mangrovi]|uniref:Uncharacterized protein n=1 Tax=Acuticoccus mangrovi TaxID=2796142 RepID=A0A934IL40_9HYPH|nr:hypothetical protein [Acuticoccus mangrovi]MBJ3774293.1 hypothetical protein [Acuticoccus mangrovi]
MSTLTQDQHDKAVRFIATNRFPFPDQPAPSWPLHYRTYINTPTHPQIAIETPAGPHYPDIVIRDGSGRIREIGEVETDLDDPHLVARWAAASLAADDTTPTKARHLLIYVPQGREREAEALLETNAISYHALRGIRVAADGTVHVLPHKTLGNTKDHRPDSPPDVADDPVVEAIDDAAHDAVVRFLLAERFPFPGEGQETWPLDYHALANTRLHRRRPAVVAGEEVWPDIVVVDAADTIMKIGEVETEVGEASVARWRALSETVALEGHYEDPETGRPAKHFLLYVPAPLAEATRDLVARHGISCAGVRGYEVTRAGRVRLPVVLPPVVRDPA